MVRFSANGSSRIYCTYLGGSGDDYVAVNNGLAIDAAGNAIVIGVTNSLNFPVSSNAFQKTLRGGEDGFVSILSADGTALLRSTYIGGSANEETSGVAVDPLGNVYFSGNTQSSDYPVTANAFQQNHRGGAGNTDGWLTKLSPDLSTLLYSTYLGGSGTTGAFGDRGRALALDSGGNIILSGDTNSSDFPVTPGVYQPAYRGGADAFLAKFAPS